MNNVSNLKMIKTVISANEIEENESAVFGSFYLPIVDQDDQSLKSESALELMISEAEDLLSRVLPVSEIDDFLAPVRHALLRTEYDQSVKGFAIFRSESAIFISPLKIRPQELVVIANSFHIKPLLRCISLQPICFSIAVSERQIRVFKINGKQTELLKIYYNDLKEQADQLSTRGGRPRKKTKELTDRFLHSVTKRMIKDVALHRQSVAIFGPKPLRKKVQAELNSKGSINIFFESSMYSSLEEMAAAIEPSLKKEIMKRSQQSAKKVVKNIDRVVVTDSLPEIAEAAIHGRIDKLYIDPTVEIWGLYDRDLGLLSTHTHQMNTQDDCVVDDIAEEVIKRNGEVVFFDSNAIEGRVPYMATLRW